MPAMATKASLNAILQSRAMHNRDRAHEAALLADPEYIAIRARIHALPRDRADRTPIQQSELRDLLNRKYERAEQLGA